VKLFWPLETKDWKGMIDHLRSTPPLSPFHQDVVAFLKDISKELLTNRTYREYPELAALGYWMRKSHLFDMEQRFKEKINEKIVRPRGVVLHFAPSNVDTIFVYSWALSMLAGNNNVLRVSNKSEEQTQVLISLICSCLQKERHKEVAKRTVILTYEHNSEITEYLSQNCHVRVIWGGDETVKTIRSIPLAPLATELAFPDRFSLCAIKNSAVANISEEQFDQLIHNFFNDSFLFGQMACSSPKLIAWIGDCTTTQHVRKKFWKRLERYMSHQLYDFSAALQIQKMATGYYFSMKKETELFEFHPHFSLLQANTLNQEFRERHCGGGFFIEAEFNTLEQLASSLVDKDQTLSYYGFTREELVRFVNTIPNRSIDRIVPIGQALHFGDVWDGFDLLSQFTREIVVR
jgi:Acyl-CoA reductase (LuxC)